MMIIMIKTAVGRAVCFVATSTTQKKSMAKIKIFSTLTLGQFDFHGLGQSDFQGLARPGRPCRVVLSILLAVALQTP